MKSPYSYFNVIFLNFRSRYSISLFTVTHSISSCCSSSCLGLGNSKTGSANGHFIFTGLIRPHEEGMVRNVNRYEVDKLALAV